MRGSLLVIATSALLFSFAPAAHAQVSVDIHIGQPPPPPRVYRVAPRPAPGYTWVEGYWYPQGKKYVWHDGYWTRPPYQGAYWVAPYYASGRYYAGRWEGGRGNVFHDHGWDHTKARDEHHQPHKHDDHRR
jgi:hypothetical protein